MNPIALQIKLARKALGISQSALALMTGVSQPTVANWESGSHAPRHAALEKIEHALGGSPAWQDVPALKIHPVPLLGWPENTDALDRAQALRYINVEIAARRPLALSLENGASLILDRAQNSLDGSGTYLVDSDGAPILLRYDDNDARLSASKLMPDAQTANKAPIILAKALLLIEPL
ncbi:MAG: helix-turn-helix transcriptional regulator [Robiginitomaculum sp.]